VTYLGANLPAVDIALVGQKIGARAIAISLTYPEDDPMVAAELRRLRELVGPRMALLVGGRAIAAYATVLDEIGALQIRDLPALRAELAKLRLGPGR
jgi:MerR family transcriptional regulator, light-induced transcriptional regulator